MMEPEYVVCMQDDRVEIVGPFVSQTAAADYGRAWQKREGDRPTWQCVTLPQGVRSVRFLAPQRRSQRRTTTPEDGPCTSSS